MEDVGAELSRSVDKGLKAECKATMRCVLDSSLA